MATYYVSQTTGLNINNGTSPTTPWQTLAFALGAASGTNPGIVGGDIIYIAPGTYNESVTINFTSPSSTVQIIGDPLNSQGFPNVNGGNILWWHGTSAVLIATSKNNISIANIYFERTTTNGAVAITTTTCYNWTFTKCIIVSGVSATSVSPNAQNWTISRCIVCAANNQDGILFTTGAGANYVLNINISDCLLFSTTGGGATSNIATRSGNGNGGLVTNCTMLHPNVNIQLGSSNTTNKLMVQNCLCMGQSAFYISPSGQLDSQNNRYLINVGFNGVVGTGSTSAGLTGLDFGNARLFGYGLNDFFGSNAGSPNIGFGTSANAPTVDLYGQTWASLPDVGSTRRSELSNFQPPTAPYAPAEKADSIYTVAQGSTFQTIELYLGATGLTPTSAGLVAHYVRSKSAPVQIPLVAQTPTGSWVSGGFCEISASTVPGLYRLDVPNGAFADGAENVTIYVRGAAGSNGAVVDVSMSYPVTAQMVRMGPYKLISNHMGADNPLEVLKGVQAPVDLQLVDNSGGGVDITGATVTAKIYNASSQLIDTYTCTPTYALDGRCSFNLDTTVTDNSGHYTVTVTRQVGGNIVVFGPLRCLVRAN